MDPDFNQTYKSVCVWAKSKGITVHHNDLKSNKAGEFDGVSVTMNNEYSVEERTYYLGHAIGSIVRWSLNTPEIQQIFHEVRASKKE